MVVEWICEERGNQVILTHFEELGIEFVEIRTFALPEKKMI